MNTLPQSFYARPARDVAAALLGKILVRELQGQRLHGRIVETEAYCDSTEPDLACHGTKNGGRPTPRNTVMFGPAGHAYIYFTYGNHWMLNVVSGRTGQANAVLIRALEPLSDLEPIAQLRGKPLSALSTQSSLLNLTNGPGKLAQAFAIDHSCNGKSLFEPESGLWVEDAAAIPPDLIATGPRVGLGQTPEPWFSMPWRYWIAGNPFVSKFR